MQQTASEGYIGMQFGDLELYIFSDGMMNIALQPIIAPDISETEVNNVSEKLFLPIQELNLSLNYLLIKKDDRLILFDTGFGFHFDDNAGKLNENLEKAGIKSEQITDVFITHAHGDHIGGIVDKDDKLIYPNAQYHIAKKEYDFWMSENPDFSKSKNTSNPAGDISFVRNIFNRIIDKLDFFDYGSDLFGCIKTELAEGHTSGHTIFSIYSNDKIIKHIVDVFHSLLLVAHPEWGAQWDEDFEMAVATRKRILEESERNKTCLLSAHLPYPGIGYINKCGDEYKWNPLAYYVPNKIIL